VEHSCEKCGSVVEDGRPFCPHCRAPQIHVQVAVAEDGPSGGAVAEPSPISQISIERAPTLEHALFDQSAGARAAIKAGVVGVLLGWILPFVGILVTGSIAVYFYRRERGLILPPRIASRLGGAAGLVAFSITFLAFVVLLFGLHGQQAYIDYLLKNVQTMGRNATDPEMQSAAHFAATPVGIALTYLFGAAVSMLLAAAGGALASVAFRHRTRN
jgi:hypothetical protein